MKTNTLSSQVSVSGQISLSDLDDLAEDGVQIVVCNRPDGEAADQTSFSEISIAANNLGMKAVQIAFSAGQLNDQMIAEFQEVIAAGLKTHAYCRTGNRSSVIHQAAMKKGESGQQLGESSESDSPSNLSAAKPHFDVLIIGAGSGGIAVSASLLKRVGNLRIALVDAATKHYYQPGWTMVGGGVFSAESTERETASLIDRRVSQINHNASEIVADQNKVVLDDGSEIYYQQLIVAPGLVLDWSAIEGLEESLGKNGVTSNYRYDLAPYTWELVQKTVKGRAIFTQPPMPIKCAGAPQKALYLSADHWYKTAVIKDIEIDFCNAGAGLFGVQAYVPALMEYIEKYAAKLSFNQNLIKVDGENKTATFSVSDADGNKTEIEKHFDMLHVCPPQRAPDFISESGLSNDAGWLSVDPGTLQHTEHSNIWGLGDVMSTSNAKTLAAVRKQVPVVAENICAAIVGAEPRAEYDGYGSCPLTVERGKIVLAEFCYGGRVAPTFPAWINNGLRPTRLAWWLKATALPPIYWHAMLKGREWLTESSAG